MSVGTAAGSRHTDRREVVEVTLRHCVWNNAIAGSRLSIISFVRVAYACTGTPYVFVLYIIIIRCYYTFQTGIINANGNYYLKSAAIPK